MSDAKKFSELPSVTSLSSTGSLIVTDTNGNMGKILPSVVETRNQRCTSFPTGVNSGWVRIAYFYTEGFGLFYCSFGWGNAGPQAVLLSAQGHINGGTSYNKVNNLLSIANGGVTKGRIVKSGNVLYVDLYFSARPGNIYADLIKGRGANMTDIQFNPEVASTDTVWETAWGG